MMKEEIVVTFQQSGISVPWNAFDGSLLEFAEASGVEISSGCTYGDCGTCLTSLIAGEVRYLHETGVQPEPGTCLPCSCQPVTDITLEC
jgi:ferredoxin